MMLNIQTIFIKSENLKVKTTIPGKLDFTGGKNEKR